MRVTDAERIAPPVRSIPHRSSADIEGARSIDAAARPDDRAQLREDLAAFRADLQVFRANDRRDLVIWARAAILRLTKALARAR